MVKTKAYKSRVTFLILVTMFLGLTYLPLLAPADILEVFVREDGVAESLTVVYLLVTSVLFIACFVRFRRSSWVLKVSYLGLALLFFIGAGEEVSWGERVFHWDDHNYIRGLNVQNELTIHNLKYFQGEEAVLPVSISQLFIAFVSVFAVIIPLACKLFPRLANFLTLLIPVLPWDVGLLAVATYLFQKGMLRILPRFPALYQHPSMPVSQGIHEIREHGYVLALMLSTLFYFWMKKKVTEAEDSREVQKNITGPLPEALLNAESAGDKP